MMANKPEIAVQGCAFFGVTHIFVHVYAGCHVYVCLHALCVYMYMYICYLHVYVQAYVCSKV